MTPDLPPWAALCHVHLWPMVRPIGSSWSRRPFHYCPRCHYEAGEDGERSVKDKAASGAIIRHRRRLSALELQDGPVRSLLLD